MKIAIGGDHAGFSLKEEIKANLRVGGYEVIDKGTHSEESVDYPDFAGAVAEAVRIGEAERGIILCGSGVGACIAANKIKGVRASVCHDTYSAHQGVEHDDMNVLCLGARIVGPSLALELVRTFLAARFTREERHMRRLGKVLALETQDASSVQG
ncbi:MAG: ribose 5-phosphate isomerase B [Thermodesulfobacteriota bacterium]